jgi:uncharacterized membrane protein
MQAQVKTLTSPTTNFQPLGTARRPSSRLRAQLVLAVPAILLALTAVLRWMNGQASVDIVVYDQGLWALSRGFKPWSSVVQETLLEDHFGPGVFVFGALYRLVASPVWLLVAQVGAAWWSVRILARRLAPAAGELQAAVVGAALLVSPPVAYALLFDFHSVTLAVPFALMAILALEDSEPRRALLFGLLAALFRAEVGLAVAVAFAIWPGSRRHRLRTGAVLAGYLLVALYFEKALGHDSYWPIHYGHLGASPSAALQDPVRLLRTVLSLEAIGKAFPWIATGAFMALRRPRRLLPVAVLALPVLLSQWPGTLGVEFQYGYAPTLLLALAWLPAVTEKPDRSRHVVAACLFLTVLFGPVVPGLLERPPLESFAGKYWAPDSEARCIVAGIPVEAAHSATQPFTVAAHRRTLYLWPYPFQGAPPTMLPGQHLAQGNSGQASGVDYIVIFKPDADLVPAGFVPDGASRQYLRFRRADTTTPSEPDCS